MDEIKVNEMENQPKVSRNPHKKEEAPKVAGQFVYSDDAEHVAKIKEGLKRKTEKFGQPYCPCVTPLAHCEDTICPCKAYRETGKCHCRMFKA